VNESLVGMTLGPYELHAPLGQGGMATVYRGFQPSLSRTVAVKVLSLARLPDPMLPARFRREAQLAASLMHPNVVPVYDFGEWQGYLYIVMALVTGGTLKDRMEQRPPVDAIVQLVGQVADGLAYAHGQGIFHRDVKPTNVLLASADWAMLGDFGIARALGDMTRLTGPYGTIGTPAYMAPEQWVGGDIDGRADIYSLGIVLYQMLTGSVPFTAPTAEGLMRQHLEMPVPSLSSRQIDLPAGLDDVVQTALAKEPGRRYRHAGEFKAALEAAGKHTQATGFHGQTNLAPIGPLTTGPDLGPTMQVARQQLHGETAERPSRAGGVNTALVALVLVLVVLLAGAVGYIAAGGRLVSSDAPAPTATVGSAASQPGLIAQTPAPPAATPTTPPAPTAQATTEAQPPPATTAPPTATAAPPPPKPTVLQPTAPAKVQSPGAADQRLALVERRIGDYFAALNAGDFARAQMVCCTPGWRARYPLDEWRKNFTGVTDLRFATPVRHTTVEPSRIVAEVDYSFANSSGARRLFTLRWTFVPSGNDWLADDAVASQR
jgi:tRNA A-37 threonylcarbamoyl transferase component Bud32